MASKGVIQLKGNRGKDPDHIVRMTVANPIDALALSTFKTYLTTSITDCVAPITSYTEQDIVSTGPIPGDVNVDVVAVFVLRDTTSGSLIRTSVASPKAGIIVPEANGDRIDEATVNGFAAAYSTMTGKTIDGMYGYVLQRR